jgi:CHAT domain-containing protein/tetratricopeptide (TPR) repeat protein
MTEKSLWIRLRVAPLINLLAVFLIIHFVGGCSSRSAVEEVKGQSSPSLPLLTQDVSLSQEIKGATSQSYEVDLTSGQYLNVTIAKTDLQLKVKFYAPDEKTSAEFLSRRYGPLHLSFIAEQSGRHRIEVLSLEKSESSSYVLKVEKLDAASQADRTYTSASNHYFEAERLRSEWEEKLFRSAIDLYKNASTEWLSINKQTEAAVTLEDIGDTYFVLSDYTSALTYYQQALAIRQTYGTDLEKISTLNNIGYALVYLTRTDDARRYLQQVIDYCQTKDKDSKEPEVGRVYARALNNFGELYYALSDLPKALESFQQALGLRDSLKDRRGAALAELNLGYAYYDLGHMDDAAKHYQRALDLSQLVDDRRQAALAGTALGGVNTFLGEKQLALDFHAKALKVFRLIGDSQGEAATLNGIGKAYEDLNDYQTSLDNYSRALTLYEKIGNRDFEALTHYYVGRSYRLAGNFPEAFRHYDRCISLSRRLGNPRFEAYALKDLGIIYNAQGQREKALEQFQQVLAIYQKDQDRRGQAHTLNGIGYVYYQIGKLNEAVNYFMQALPLSRLVTDRQAEISILYNLARANRDEGNLQLGLSQVRDSINIIESLRAKVGSRDLRTSYFASVHQHYELYVDLLMRSGKQTGDNSLVEAALQASEQSRARSLLEMVSEIKNRGRYVVDPALLERKQNLEKSLADKAEYQMRLLNRAHTDEMATGISNEIHELSVQLNSVQSEIRTQSPGYALLTQPQMLQFKDIQSEVPDENTLLLEFSLGEDRSYLWLVTRSTVSAYELPNQVTIEKACRRVYDLLIARQPKAGETSGDYQQRVAQSDRDFCHEANSLGQMLLGPIADQLGRKKLLISGDGGLQYIPFDVLSISSVCREQAQNADAGLDGYVPLVADHEIVNLPSVSVLAALRHQKSGTTSKTVLVFADPVFETNDPRLTNRNDANPRVETIPEDAQLDHALRDLSNLGNDFRIVRLPSTLREANAILAVTAADEGKMFTGVEASRAVVMGPELAQYRIVHFATHGIVDSDNPELSGLVLSRVDRDGNRQNGFLRLPDIYNLDLNANLVVLSACRTGLGKAVTGEGLVGLTQGFMYAGAKGVIGSLWKVDDEATSELMSGFYSSMLKDGLTPSAALQASKVAMLKQKRWQSPFYWSAFVLQGEYERLPDSGEGSHKRAYLLTAAAILMLVFVSFGFYRLTRTRRPQPPRSSGAS